MKALLFEDPFWLYGMLAVAAAVLLWRWWRTRRRAHGLWAGLPLALGLGVFAVSTLVVTDREEIQAATRAIVDAVADGRTGPLQTYLDRDFRATLGGRTFDRDSALRRVREALDRGEVKKVEIAKNEVQVQETDAFQRLLTHIRHRQGRLPVLWQVHWIRTEQGWRIYDVKEPRIGVTP